MNTETEESRKHETGFKRLTRHELADRGFVVYGRSYVNCEDPRLRPTILVFADPQTADEPPRILWTEAGNAVEHCLTIARNSIRRAWMDGIPITEAIEIETSIEQALEDEANERFLLRMKQIQEASE